LATPLHPILRIKSYSCRQFHARPGSYGVTYANRKLVRNRRLSTAETAALARAVLERARQALHESQKSAALELPRGKPRIGAGDSRRPSRQGPISSTFSRSGIGAKVASAIGQQFECVVIAACLIITGTAWIVHLAV
jgi:hypothetical protein